MKVELIEKDGLLKELQIEVPADTVNGRRLAAAVSHWELKVDRLTDHEQRPRFHCQIVHAASHRPWTGFNRAQAAVLEAAILVSRLHLLSPEKIRHELDYLAIAIGKTAGEEERVAWGWLMDKVKEAGIEPPGG